MLLLLTPAAQAGPWVKPPGEAYLKAGSSAFMAQGFVRPDGVAIDGAEYLGVTSHIYGEIGLVGPLQAVVNLPFVGSRNTFRDRIYVNRQFGDLDVGLEAGTEVGGSVPISLQLLTKLPLYDNAELRAHGPASDRFPAIGDGQVDVTAMGAVGSGLALGGFRGWCALEAGYRHRTEIWMGDSSAPDRALLDGIPWRVQIGWSPRFGEWDAGWWSLDAAGIQGFQSDAVTRQWVQVGSSLGVTVSEGVAIEAGFTEMVWARASAQGRSISGGLSWTR